MTAPTPDQPISVRAQVMGIRSMAAFHRTNKIDLPLADVFDSHADIISTLGESLAAVTAERDQERGQHEATKSTLDKAWDDLRPARQMLADAEKKIASMELDESLREEDERFADPL